ncbi:MAG: ABC transporter ATP-binding protein [Chloroherpetonaceae bacterium]|nr:ABC transporter ATP-binding protein [Chthonomonadaceae bacterium]MDW8207696.1 ABC transporter ATP-binding protein [Chloroherpetonaceae bacterium]
MSLSELALSVRRLSKAYTLTHDRDRPSTAQEALIRWLRAPLQRPQTETFYALREVDFDLPSGAVLGIVGRNGAGKSTLLKILSRITDPTEGEVVLYGRVGSLLEVGTGFHPELTGRENIFLNGAVLGMRRREIARKFDAIVDFAGIEAFLDTPVKRYSSGMYVRLAFSVAAHLEPEILLVDEVLAVGDAEFQKRCLGKMKDVASSGRTVLFVSHNMAAVTNLCTLGMVLDAGRVTFLGSVEEAVRSYLESLAPGGCTERRDVSAFRPGWARPCITSVRLLDARGQMQNRFAQGDDIRVEITFVSPERPIHRPVMGVVVHHLTSGVVGGVNNWMTGPEFTEGPYTGARMTCILRQPPLIQGQYLVDVWLSDGKEDIDTLTGCLTLHVEPADVYGTGRPPFGHLGVVYFRSEWSLQQEPPGVLPGACGEGV